MVCVQNLSNGTDNAAKPTWRVGQQMDYPPEPM